MPNYLPEKQQDFLDWNRTFGSYILESPPAYNLTQAQVDEFATTFAAFEAAYLAADNTATRTPGAIEQKRVTMKALRALDRHLVGIIQSAPSTTDVQRRNLQITIRDYSPTPIGPPTVMPQLIVKAVMGQVLRLELRRQDGSSRRKPAGVRAARLYSFVGATPPSELEAWTFSGSVTRTDAEVTFPNTATPGTTVWVTAQWMSPTDEPGPACAPVQSRINYMGLNQAA